MPILTKVLSRAWPVAAVRTSCDLALGLPVATCQVEAGWLPGSALALLREQNWCSWLESPPGLRMLLQKRSRSPYNLKSDYGLEFLSSAVPHLQKPCGQGEDSACSLSGCISGYALPSSFLLISSFAHSSIHSLKGIALGLSWSPCSITC